MTDLEFDVLDGRRLGYPQPRVLSSIPTLTNAFRLPRSTCRPGSRLLFRMLAAALLWQTVIVFTGGNRFRTQESHGDVGEVVIAAPGHIKWNGAVRKTRNDCIYGQGGERGGLTHPINPALIRKLEASANLPFQTAIVADRRLMHESRIQYAH